MIQRFNLSNVEVFKFSKDYILIVNDIIYILHIFLDKLIYEEYGFPHPLILTASHFVFSFLALGVCLWLGIFKYKRLPLSDVLPACVSYFAYISISNLSLMLNPMAFFQLTKLFLVLMLVLKRVRPYTKLLSPKILTGFTGISVGVWITINSSEVTFLGITVAFASVITGILYNRLLFKKIERLNINAIQILPYQLFISSISIPILFCTLDLDNFIYPKVGTQLLIFLSSAISAFLNISRAESLSFFNPTKNKILSIAKLCVVMFILVPIIEHRISFSNLFGIILTAASFCGGFMFSKGV